MKTILFSILCLLTFQFVWAQEEVLLKGRLRSEDSTGIDRVNVLNMTHKYGTVTNDNGEFEMPVYLGDTILFSAIQYKNIEIYISDSMLAKAYIEQVMEFENITLQDIILTDGFSMLDTTPHTFGEIDMGLPFNTVPVKKNYSDRRESYLTSKLSSSVISALTGDLKKLRKIQEVEEQIAITEEVKGIFDDEFYKGLDIPKTNIYNFIDFYLPKAKSKGLLRRHKTYELIAFIKTQAPLFIEKQTIQTDSILISD